MEMKCEICQIDFLDQNNYQGHLQGKKHLKRVQQSETLQSLVHRSIFVSKLSPYLTNSNALLEFFSRYGEIQKHRFGNGNLIVEFTSSEPVEYLLSNRIYFQNVRLSINRRIIHDKPFVKKDKNKEPETINNTDELDFKNLKSIFNTEASFNEQLTAFLDAVSISTYEIESRYTLTCSKLNEIFQKVYPKCKTHRFGSTVSGLGFKNCDLDIYLDIGLSNKFAAFSEIKSILYAKSNIITNVVPIPKAKTPIIKFTYIPTNISCDISFKNCLGVYNSKLLKYCLSLDHRLRPAMMVLKYWVCNFELQGGSKISKYALTLLFVFYCQQPSVGFIPPIIELKNKCQPEIIDGWQVNFDSSPWHPVQKNEDMSIPELLRGFFNFYANYNFKMNVVCPIDGFSHNKLILNSTDTIPSSLNRYKEYLISESVNAIPLSLTKPMCIQDPNELNHNVTGNICAKYIETFQKYCAAAAEICANAVKNEYKEFLPGLFSLVIDTKPKDSPNISFLIYANNSVTVGLPANFESRTDIVDKQAFMNENWFNITLDLIQKYLEKVLKFQIQLCIDQEMKQQKTDTESDVHSASQNKVVLRCIGEYCLWRDRKGISTDLDTSTSLLEKEKRITDNIYEQIISKNKVQKTKIEFECHIVKKNVKNVHLIVTLHNHDCQRNLFFELRAYLKSKIPHVLNKTLIHMMQFKKKTINC